jgi:phosphoribosylanthranilate isomerase
MTRVKICGCMCVADALAAKDAGADFIGLMFAESRRRVSFDEASQIVQALGGPFANVEEQSPPVHVPGGGDVETWFAHGATALDRLLAQKRPLVVGVFADQTVEEMNEVCDEAGLDLVQLSGDEPWSDVAALNRQAINVIRTHASTTSDEIMSAIEGNTSLAVMLDDSRGTGALGDWHVAGEIARQMPVWLAGGLTVENVASAIESVRPWAVDVSTGVETTGAKDAAKIAAFVAAAKGVRV